MQPVLSNAPGAEHVTSRRETNHITAPACHITALDTGRPAAAPGGGAWPPTLASSAAVTAYYHWCLGSMDRHVGDLASAALQFSYVRRKGVLGAEGQRALEGYAGDC